VSELIKKEQQSTVTKISLEEHGQEIGHGYLYLIKNDLHEQPYGFMEDVFVEDSFRGKGVGMQIVQALITEAKVQGCYKLIGTSRNARAKVHEFYKKLGFTDYGKEFRMEL
jgi:GNAT superfamily N-acetyltransferase